jgi:hypothetical protein
MPPRLGLFSTVLILALVACTQPENGTPDTPTPVASAQPAPPSDSAEPEPAANECGANKLGAYLNQLPTSDAMLKIRTTIGHERIRTINPGDAVTMDFRSDRLNVEIGEDGRIKRLRCG